MQLTISSIHTKIKRIQGDPIKKINKFHIYTELKAHLLSNLQFYQEPIIYGLGSIRARGEVCRIEGKGGEAKIEDLMIRLIYNSLFTEISVRIMAISVSATVRQVGPIKFSLHLHYRTTLPRPAN